MRHLGARLAIVLAAAVAAAALVVLVVATRDSEPSVDCSGVRFDRATWRDARGDLSPRQALGRGLAACGTLVGKTRRDIRAMLGAPDDRSPGEVAYELGPDSLGVDSQFLGIRFGDGVVTATETYDG